MDIKDKLVSHGMIWSEADQIEYNTIGAFQTSDINTPGYYIFQWIGNAYTLQEQYTYYAFDTRILIFEGELVCSDKLMNPTRKTSYWYHNPDE